MASPEDFAVDDRVLAEVGRIIVGLNTVDLLLAMILATRECGFADLVELAGAGAAPVNTEFAQNASRLLDRCEAVAADLSRGSGDRLRDLVREVRALHGERNVLAHAVWVRGQEAAVTGMRARRDGAADVHEYTLDELHAIYERVHAALLSAVAVRMDLSTGVRLGRARTAKKGVAQ